jgi:hypothetical protein
MPGAEMLRQTFFLGQGQESTNQLNPGALNDYGTVVHWAFLGEDAGNNFWAKLAAQNNPLPEMLGQSVSLLENDQGACATFGHLEDGSFNLGEVNCPRFIWSPQKQPDRIGLNENLADFVSENHNDDQYGNSTDTLEEPTGKHEPAGLGDSMTQPKKKNAQ